MKSQGAYTVIILVIVALGILIWPRIFSNEDDIISNPNENMANSTLTLTSLAFKDDEFIPAKYTCDGQSINPPLTISGVPENVKSLVLIMDDPDVPKALRPDGVFDHWVVYNIPPKATLFDEGELFGTTGLNGRGESKYAGPCPPTNYEPTTHRYFFKLYAANLPALSFIKPPTKAEVLKAIEGHIVAETTLIGKYDRTMQKR